MVYVYAYAPCSGTSGPQSQYCNGDAHVTVSCIGGSQPLDIMTSSQVGVYLHTSGAIPKCKITRCSGVCKSGVTPWTYGLKVDLYLDHAATRYLGTLGYGHVENRIADGTYDTLNLMLGTLPSNCDCPCSKGIHVHVQGNGEANWFGNCSSRTITKGSTWIYRWLANI